MARFQVQCSCGGAPIDVQVGQREPQHFGDASGRSPEEVLAVLATTHHHDPSGEVLT